MYRYLRKGKRATSEREVAYEVSRGAFFRRMTFCEPGAIRYYGDFDCQGVADAIQIPAVIDQEVNKRLWALFRQEFNHRWAEFERQQKGQR